jgi:hypothetical protein
MKVKVSKQTAKLLNEGKLVDSSTGELHQAIPFQGSAKLRMVTSGYVRVKKSVAHLPEAAYAVAFLSLFPDGVVPKGLDRTSRWRIAKLVSGGYAVKLPKCGYLIDPNLFSCSGYPVSLLPESFR